MPRLALPALLAGLLVVTTALADDAPRAKGHALGADMASLMQKAPPADLAPAVDPAGGAPCGTEGGDCPADTGAAGR